MTPIADRWSQDYQPPIVEEPAGGPIPGTSGADDAKVVKAAADPHAAALQRQWEQARADLLTGWPDMAGPLVDELAGQAEEAAAADDPARLGELQASAQVLAALAVPLNGSGSKLARQAAASVVAEAADAGVTIAAPADAGAQRVRQTADAVAQLIARGYAAGAARIGLQLAGADPADVRDAVNGHLADLGQSSNGLVADNLGALLSAAQHAGRLTVMEAHPIRGVRAVEVNDQRRCPACAEAADRVYPTLRAALKDYPAAGNKSCAGGGRCRGFLRPIWQ